MSGENKNDRAWRELFERYEIAARVAQQGYYEISSAEINPLRQARLMAKFDHKYQLPRVFKDSRLNIIPISRGKYLIGYFDCYQELKDASESVLESCSLPANIETIDPSNLYSETSLLMCADHAGMVSRLIEEEVSFTVFGRMTTGEFSFRLNGCCARCDHEIEVRNAQCEIDAGFEGEKSFVIVEAKSQQVDDFHIRQLYYPYRAWQNRTSKKIVPVFLYYSDDIFNFFVYQFKDKEHYNSIELIKIRRFRISAPAIELPDLIEVFRHTTIVGEPECPFPQADSFPRIVDLLGLILENGGTVSKDFVTENFALDERQTEYYTSAAVYLGLIVKQQIDKGVNYCFSTFGKEVMALKPKNKKLALVKQILTRSVFNKTMELYLAEGKRPSVESTTSIMREQGLLTSIGSTTIKRRAQTVLSWLDWILQLAR